MNERIRECLTQAISDVDYIRDDPVLDQELSEMFIPDCFAERFAELIIKECVDAHYEDYQLDIISDVINKHFGFEDE